MVQHSAGILLYRVKGKNIHVLLVHPGGPFWEGKDLGAWSIPKGLNESNEELLQTAKREFFEETGFNLSGDFVELGKQRQPSGKIVHVWALEGDVDTDRLVSNTFYLEWPRHSGVMCEYPEVDKGAWFNIETAKDKIHKGQRIFLDRLMSILSPEQAAEIAPNKRGD